MWNPGQQVWITVDGYPPWPARIVNPDDVGYEGERVSDQVCCKFYVTEDLWYGPTSSLEILDYDSEMAKVDSEDVQAALNAARQDLINNSNETNNEAVRYEEANLTMDSDDAAGLLASEEDVEAGTKEKEKEKKEKHKKHKKDKHDKKEKDKEKKKDKDRSHKQEKIRPEEPTKRVREEEPTRNVQKTKTKRAPSPHLEPIRDHPIVASQDEILELRSEIEQIMSDNQPSLIELRQALIKLSRSVVDIHLLRSTRIAHLLTKIVRTPSLSRLHALCRALLVSWIGKLPEDMRNALRWVNQSQNEFVAQPSMVSLGSDSQVNPRTARCENFKTYVVDPDIAVAIDDAITNIPNDPQLSRRLVAALKKNKQLCDDLRDRKLAVEDFVKMTPAELMNSEEKAMADMKRQQTLELRTQQSQGSVTQVTNKYPCTECRNEKCSFNEVQMRGADEPATIFLMCLACGHTFTPDD